MKLKNFFIFLLLSGAAASLYAFPMIEDPSEQTAGESPGLVTQTAEAARRTAGEDNSGSESFSDELSRNSGISSAADATLAVSTANEDAAAGATAVANRCITLVDQEAIREKSARTALQEQATIAAASFRELLELARDEEGNIIDKDAQKERGKKVLKALAAYEAEFKAWAADARGKGKPEEVIDNAFEANAAKLIESLDVSTEKDGAVFWTGFDLENQRTAKAYAKEKKKKTIEMTRDGSILDQLGMYTETSPIASPALDEKGAVIMKTDGTVKYASRLGDALFVAASKKFAEGATGKVTAVIYKPEVAASDLATQDPDEIEACLKKWQQVYEKSTYCRIEEPILSTKASLPETDQGWIKLRREEMPVDITLPALRALLKQIDEKEKKISGYEKRMDLARRALTDDAIPTEFVDSLTKNEELCKEIESHKVKVSKLEKQVEVLAQEKAALEARNESSLAIEQERAALENREAALEAYGKRIAEEQESLTEKIKISQAALSARMTFEQATAVITDDEREEHGFNQPDLPVSDESIMSPERLEIKELLRAAMARKTSLFSACYKKADALWNQVKQAWDDHASLKQEARLFIKEVERDSNKASVVLKRTLDAKEAAAKKAHRAASQLEKIAFETEARARAVATVKSKRAAEMLKPPINSNMASWCHWATRLVEDAVAEKQLIEKIVSYGIKNPKAVAEDAAAIWVDRMALSLQGVKNYNAQKAIEMRDPSDNLYQAKRTVADYQKAAKADQESLEGALAIKANAVETLQEINEDLTLLKKVQSSDPAIETKEAALDKAISELQQVEATLEPLQQKATISHQTSALYKENLKKIRESHALLEKKLQRDIDRATAHAKADKEAWRAIWPERNKLVPTASSLIAADTKIHSTLIDPPPVHDEIAEKIARDIFAQKQREQEMALKLSEQGAVGPIENKMSSSSAQEAEQKDDDLSLLPQPLQESLTSKIIGPTRYDEERVKVFKEWERLKELASQAVLASEQELQAEPSEIESVAPSDTSGLTALYQKAGLSLPTVARIPIVPSVRVLPAEEFFERDVLMAYRLVLNEKERWKNLVKKSAEELGIAINVENAAELDPWFLADKEAVNKIKEYQRSQEELERAARMQRRWMGDKDRWQALAEFDQAKEDADKLVKIAEENGRNAALATGLLPGAAALLSEAFLAADTKANAALEIQKEKWKEWKKCAANHPVIKGLIAKKQDATSAEKQLEAEDRATYIFIEKFRLTKENLPSTDRANENQAVATLPTDQSPTVQSESRSWAANAYKKELDKKKKLDEKHIFPEKSDDKKYIAKVKYAHAATRAEAQEIYKQLNELEEQRLADYEATAIEDALKDAREKRIGALEAWKDRAKRAVRLIEPAQKLLASQQEEEAKEAAARGEEVSFSDAWRRFQRIKGMAMADGRAYRAFQRETERLDDIKKTWLAERDAEKRLHEINMESAVHDYAAGDVNAWQTLLPGQRTAYHQEVEEANKLYHKTADEKIAQDFRLASLEKEVTEFVKATKMAAKLAFLESGKLRYHLQGYRRINADDETAHDLLDETMELFQLAGEGFEKATEAMMSEQPPLAILWKEVATRFQHAAQDCEHARKIWSSNTREEFEALGTKVLSQKKAAETLSELIEAIKTTAKNENFQIPKDPEQLMKLLHNAAEKAGAIAKTSFNRAKELRPHDPEFENAWNKSKQDAIAAEQAYEQTITDCENLRATLPASLQEKWDTEKLEPAKYNKAAWAAVSLVRDVQKAVAIAKTSFNKAKELQPHDPEFENAWNMAKQDEKAAAQASELVVTACENLRATLLVSQQAKWDANVLEPTKYNKADCASIPLWHDAQKLVAIANASFKKAQALQPHDLDFENAWNKAKQDAIAAEQVYELVVTARENLRSTFSVSQQAKWDANVLEPTKYEKAIWASRPLWRDAQKLEAIAKTSFNKAKELQHHDPEFENAWNKAKQDVEAAAQAYELVVTDRENLRATLPVSHQAKWDANVLEPVKYNKADWASRSLRCDAQKIEVIANTSFNKAKELQPHDPEFENAWNKAKQDAIAAEQAYELVVTARENLRATLPISQQAEWDTNKLEPARYNKAFWAAMPLRCDAQKLGAIANASFNKATELQPHDPEFENAWNKAKQDAIAAEQVYELVVTAHENLRETLPTSQQTKWDANVLNMVRSAKDEATSHKNSLESLKAAKVSKTEPEK